MTAEVRQQAKVVRNDHEAGAHLSLLLKHQFDKLLSIVFVEVAGRLIGQQQTRPADHGSGNGNSLALAARQLGGTTVFELCRQPGSPKHSFGALTGKGGRFTAYQQRHHDVFKRVKLGQQVMELIDKAKVGGPPQARSPSFSD